LQIYVSLSTLDMHLIFQLAMRLKAKSAGAVLLVLLLCGVASASWLSVRPVQARTSGCPMHQHLPALPSPDDHSCCQSGHDTAVPQKLANSQHDVFVSFLLSSDQESISPETVAHFHSDIVSLGTPPSALQLRI
jgi:hypothetical protein